MTSLARFRRRLLLRVYLYGLLLLALSASASFLVGRYVLRPAFDLPVRPSTSWIAWRMARLSDQPGDLTRELADLKQRVGMEMTVYDAAGRLVGSNAEEPPPPLAERELKRLARDRARFEGGEGVVGQIDSAGRVTSYALVKYPRHDFPFGIAVVQLALALGILALASIPMARSVSGPIERLAALTRAFGAGDLTVRARSRRRDEIGDLAQAFDEMADRIALLRRGEKELIANVSHELRTPLARIRLALELVHDGDAARAGGYLEDIAEDLAELERLLDDVMTAARLDLEPGSLNTGTPPLRLQATDPRLLVENAALRFKKRFPERTLDQRIEGVPPMFEVDPSLLRRVLDNLLENAAKFSDESAAIELVLRGLPGAKELTIEVVDHGIGIPEEDRAEVFTPFFRGDRSRARRTGGVGLGLALAKRVVEAHGGSIEVESTVGVGSRFRVRLPAPGA
jgi:two-component system OmpR family sensor kinase